MKVIQIRPIGEKTWLVFNTINDISEYINEGNCNESWEVKMVEMSTEQFEAMKDFDGW